MQTAPAEIKIEQGIQMSEEIEQKVREGFRALLCLVTASNNKEVLKWWRASLPELIDDFDEYLDLLIQMLCEGGQEDCESIIMTFPAVLEQYKEQKAFSAVLEVLSSTKFSKELKETLVRRAVVPLANKDHDFALALTRAFEQKGTSIEAQTWIVASFYPLKQSARDAANADNIFEAWKERLEDKKTLSEPEENLLEEFQDFFKLGFID